MGAVRNFGGRRANVFIESVNGVTKGLFKPATSCMRDEGAIIQPTKLRQDPQLDTNSWVSN